MKAVEQNDAGPGFEGAFGSLREARRFRGDPQKFWQALLDAFVGIAEAHAGIVAVRRRAAGGGEAAAREDWRTIAVSPPPAAAGPYARRLAESVAEIAGECLAAGWAARFSGEEALGAVALDMASAQDECIAFCMWRGASQARVMERIGRLRLAADAPFVYQLQKSVEDLGLRMEHLAGVLDAMTLLNAQKRFLACSMTLCNELATRHGCERVSVGWLENGYVRLRAMSRVEHFDSKMEAVRKLEAAMEEALDQDADIVVPSGDADTVHTAHDGFCAEHGARHMVSLPLRLDGEPVGVCSCERAGGPFTETEQRLLRMVCDQAVRRLAELKKSDRWFGARMAAGARERLGKLLGVENTWVKAIGIGAAVLIGFLCFFRLPYRVEGSFILRTDRISYLTAPFDGHIAEVVCRVGDSLGGGDVLLRLDDSDLLLEQTMDEADRNRFAREMEKARAANELADMRIAESLCRQAEAKLALVRHRLSLAAIRASFPGTVVEGDLMEKTGAPVRQGDVLFKLACVTNLYIEVDVSEKDIHEIGGDTAGRIAFAARPQDSFPMRTVRVEPVAVPREKGNVFVIRCEAAGPAPDWWRPGMTGVAKLDAGRRTPLWMLTHRTVDFIRLRFWW